MKMTIMCSLLLLLTPAFADAQDTQWITQCADPADVSDSAFYIAVDPTTGNIYVTGIGQSVGHGADYVTVAYDASGNQLWSARYDGPPTEMIPPPASAWAAMATCT
jgi:hypothetical protein